MSVEGAKATEEVIEELYNHLMGQYKFYLEELDSKAANKDLNATIKAWTEIITECLTFLYVGPSINTFRKFKNILQNNISVHMSGEGKKKKTTSNIVDTYAAYCYFVRLSVFNSIDQGFPGGWSYDKFVENVLNENAINAEWKKESQNYRKYVSEINLKNKDYKDTILLMRRNHRGLSDKNKNNRTWEYESILPYNRVGNEFEFFMRKRNNSSKNVNGQSQIEAFRKEQIEPLLYEQGIDLSIYQNQYAKLKKMHIGEMSLSELQQYLKYIQAKKNYVYKHSKPYFCTAEILSIEEDLLLNNFEIIRILDTLNWQGLDWKEVLQDLQAIGYTIWQIIRHTSEDSESCVQRTSVLWDAIIYLLNYTDAELDKNLFDIGQIRDLDFFRNSWKTVPKLCINESKEIVRNKFIKFLPINDKYLEDYIRLSILIKYIIPHKSTVEKLKSGIIPVFNFLRICKEKSSGQIDIDIEDELLELKEILNKDGVDLDIENMETLYESHMYKEYFSYCVENQYIHLYEIIELLLSKNCELHASLVIQKYMDSILPEFADANTKICKITKPDTAEFIFFELMDCLYPNQLSSGNIDKIYAAKNYILDIAAKYDLKGVLGF